MTDTASNAFLPFIIHKIQGAAFDCAFYFADVLAFIPILYGAVFVMQLPLEKMRTNFLLVIHPSGALICCKMYRFH